MTDRLTRTELAWLLAQEARSAAQKLRQGVGMGGPEISSIPPPPPPLLDEGSGGVESTLNRLDEAVSMLASLHGQPVARGRRGRIDLAALLWEIAPEARVQIEMGEGTSVFGDEGELRRMLHVLLGQSGDPTSSRGTAGVTVRREKDEVKIGVTLGPDKPATFEAERAWLARMAVRYGGRLELDGANQTLVLPADVNMHQREVENLKKELAAAQAQGEAYARELAAVFSSLPSIPTTSSVPGGVRPSHQPATSEGLAVLVAAVRAVGADLRGILAAIGRDITPLRDRENEAGEIASSVARHITAASEIVSDLARLGACPIGELPRHANVAELVRDVVRSDLVRAARHDVRVVVEAPEAAEEVVPSGAMTVLLHALLDHAIGASPVGSQVLVTVTDDAQAVRVTFDDAGAPLPAQARGGLLSREFEVIAHGRPMALALIAANAIAANLHLLLEIDDGPQGGTRVRLVVPRGTPTM